MPRHSLKLTFPALRPQALGFFRWGGLADDRVVLTNDAGEWLLLDRVDFDALLAGRLGPGHPRHRELQERCMVRQGADLGGLADRVRRKKAFVGQGPHLHVVVTTRRCNQSCLYCHASRAPEHAAGLDMDLETARRTVETALDSPSPTVVFEFQGGEPTLNMPVVREVVEHAHRVNADRGKTVEFALVSNMTAMTEEIAAWLLEQDVHLCTSLDGPRDLHDELRRWLPQRQVGAFDTVMRWMQWFNRRYVDMGRDPELWHVDALLTTTRATLERWPEVVALYTGLGIRNLHFRPLHPLGFADRTWQRIGYGMDEFLVAYEHLLDHLIALNLDGVQVIEATAAVVLSKLLTPDDPNYVDLRSPCGAGTGQVAYDHDGRIHPCDEARLVTAEGDDRFALGKVGEVGMRQVLGHPTVKAMAIASLLEALPACRDCWNLPFCGVCPVLEWRSQGDLFGQRPRSSHCRLQMGISRMLLERLDSDGTGQVERIFRRWTLRRPRESSCPTP